MHFSSENLHFVSVTTLVAHMEQIVFGKMNYRYYEVIMSKIKIYLRDRKKFAVNTNLLTTKIQSYEYSPRS